MSEVPSSDTKQQVREVIIKFNTVGINRSNEASSGTNAARASYGNEHVEMPEGPQTETNSDMQVSLQNELPQLQDGIPAGTNALMSGSSEDELFLPGSRTNSTLTHSSNDESSDGLLMEHLAAETVGVMRNLYSLSSQCTNANKSVASLLLQLQEMMRRQDEIKEEENEIVFWRTIGTTFFVGVLAYVMSFAAMKNSSKMAGSTVDKLTTLLHVSGVTIVFFTSLPLMLAKVICPKCPIKYVRILGAIFMVGCVLLFIIGILQMAK